jgi:hypothetical protein
LAYGEKFNNQLRSLCVSKNTHYWKLQ